MSRCMRKHLSLLVARPGPVPCTSGTSLSTQGHSLLPSQLASQAPRGQCRSAGRGSLSSETL